MKKITKSPATQSKQIKQVAAKKTVKKITQQQTKLNKQMPVIETQVQVQNAPPDLVKEEQKLNLPSKLAEFKLSTIFEQIDNNYLQNKNSLILDTTQQLAVFLKYRGDIIDFPLFQLEEKMLKTKKEDFIEKVRKSFVRALHQGSTLGLLIGYSHINFQEFFKDIDFFTLDRIFDPLQIRKEEYYKKKILKPEEDVDGFGNKGQFFMKENFRICVIIYDDNLEEMTNSLKLPYHLFNFCKIVE